MLIYNKEFDKKYEKLYHDHLSSAVGYLKEPEKLRQEKFDLNQVRKHITDSLDLCIDFLGLDFFCILTRTGSLILSIP